MEIQLYYYYYELAADAFWHHQLIHLRQPLYYGAVLLLATKLPTSPLLDFVVFPLFAYLVRTYAASSGRARRGAAVPTRAAVLAFSWQPVRHSAACPMGDLCAMGEAVR